MDPQKICSQSRREIVRNNYWRRPSDIRRDQTISDGISPRHAKSQRQCLLRLRPGSYPVLGRAREVQNCFVQAPARTNNSPYMIAAVPIIRKTRDVTCSPIHTFQTTVPSRSSGKAAELINVDSTQPSRDFLLKVPSLQSGGFAPSVCFPKAMMGRANRAE